MKRRRVVRRAEMNGQELLTRTYEPSDSSVVFPERCK
jgi:hypothetical protein